MYHNIQILHISIQTYLVNFLRHLNGWHWGFFGVQPPEKILLHWEYWASNGFYLLKISIWPAIKSFFTTVGEIFKMSFLYFETTYWTQRIYNGFTILFYFYCLIIGSRHVYRRIGAQYHFWLFRYGNGVSLLWIVATGNFETAHLPLLPDLFNPCSLEGLSPKRSFFSSAVIQCAAMFTVTLHRAGLYMRTSGLSLVCLLLTVTSGAHLSYPCMLVYVLFS